MQAVEKRLKKLERLGSYVFHGTPNGEIVEFEPRQAMSHGKEDGEPCIAASEHIDPAIFMAIFSGRVLCGWNANETSFGFYAMKNDFEKASIEGWKGYVYVFERSNFYQYDGWEWRSHKKVKPLFKVEVSYYDLPKDIELR